MLATVKSFGMRNGEKAFPKGALIDCRVLPNPHNDPLLRTLTGLDPRVQHHVVQSKSTVDHLFKQALDDLTPANNHTVVFSCFGGRHRSVAVAELFAKYLREKGWKVMTEHVTLRELGVKAA